MDLLSFFKVSFTLYFVFYCFCCKLITKAMLPISSVQLLTCVQLVVTPWTAARQASLSITNFWSLLKLTSIDLVMPSNCLILYHPLLFLPSIFPSIRVFQMSQFLVAHSLKYTQRPSPGTLCSRHGCVLSHV